MAERKLAIAVARGDGIGPEIMDAALHILKSSHAPLEFHEVEIGEKVYLRGHKTGIESKTWDIIKQSAAFLKAPITTPQGGGFKSLNVTIRTTLGLYANVRPCVSYAPFVKTKHPVMDVVIVRENEEDLYAGIEYRQTPDVCQSLKLISRPGSEKIVRYAFEYARANERKKVTCFTKDNIMKFSDGLFHKVFDEIAKEYPDIQNEHWIVDIGAAKLADTPEAFDVIVMPNLYGDILSDVAAQISGSVGLAGSANIGDFGAMFEAIHGSAPRRAGQNLANPSGLILASCLMLSHLGLIEMASKIHNAWATTIEEGIHTYDIYREGVSFQKVGTKEFAQAVVKNLGKSPKQLKSVHYHKKKAHISSLSKPYAVKRTLVGIDVFLFYTSTLDELLKKIESLPLKILTLEMVSNRGARLWPQGHPETFCVDQWRCRFVNKNRHHAVDPKELLGLLSLLSNASLDIIKTEHLYLFDDLPGFSSAEG